MIIIKLLNLINLRLHTTDSNGRMEAFHAGSYDFIRRIHNRFQKRNVLIMSTT